jgi:predicted N-acetyltransferase YhbS
MAALDIKIRTELPDDIMAIDRVIAAAFQSAPHTSHTEQFIVGALRRAGKLDVSRVATHNDEIVGHIAVSPVRISGEDLGWCGLGPLSVLPSHQRRGIGSALVMEALLAASGTGAAGCVVLGDPAYYERFGFKAHGALILPECPPEHFMAVAFGNTMPNGIVSYHDAFMARD